MKLVEALNLTRSNDTRAGAPFRVRLAVGFSPLHLQTFLKAYLAGLVAGRRIDVATALYGDVANGLQPSADDLDACAVVVEWPDLSPQLGYRRAGRSAPDDADLVADVRRRLTDLEPLVAQTAQHTPTAVALPSLPLPGVFQGLPSESGAAELELQSLLVAFAMACAQRGAVVVSGQELELACPLADRHDVRTDLSSDFPYTVKYAGVLAGALAKALVPATPLKGLILDLDDTLWRGLVGEVGVDAVTWSLDAGSHVHAVFQQLINALTRQGVLVAVVSKNDPAVVEQCLARGDLIVDASKLFPIEAGWGPKSDAVSRVLDAWGGVGPEAVAFVDDSPIELAEVSNRFPALTCLRFPTESDAAVLELLNTLRALFGKRRITDEDRIRSQSLSASAAARSSGLSAQDFLTSIEPLVTVHLEKSRDDTRSLELINKTNQFNLNGRRISEKDWLRHVSRDDAVVLGISYADKFGPLGKVCVLAGSIADDELLVSSWVLSCRAFSRKIEFETLRAAFDSLPVDRIVLDYSKTERNGPLTDFLNALDVVQRDGALVVEREAFGKSYPKALFRNGDGNG